MVALSSVLLRCAFLAYIVVAEPPVKKNKGTKSVSGRVLDASCTGCFPKNRDKCETKELFTRCCEMEVNCHDDQCRGKVMGLPKKGYRVRVKVEFTSDDEVEETVPKGMSGKVLETDADGDAYIQFWAHEHDAEDEHVFHWVSKRSFWDHLERPGGAASRMRASKVVSCMDNCTLTIQKCIPFDTIKAKTMKKMRACIGTCKIQECEKDEECKPLFETYGQCKQDTAESGVCNPSEPAPKPPKPEGHDHDEM